MRTRVDFVAQSATESFSPDLIDRLLETGHFEAIDFTEAAALP
jgi:hypothetical protein